MLDIRLLVDWVFKRMPPILRKPNVTLTIFDNRLYFAEKTDDGWKFHRIHHVSTGFVEQNPATIFRGEDDAQVDGTGETESAG